MNGRAKPLHRSVKPLYRSGLIKNVKNGSAGQLLLPLNLIVYKDGFLIFLPWNSNRYALCTNLSIHESA